MALKPGQVPASGFSQSMAEAMEEALHLHWQEEMDGRQIPFDDRFLKLFFVAIAQGVVRHLVENPEAFQVDVDTHPEGGTASGEVDCIQAVAVMPPPRRRSG